MEAATPHVPIDIEKLDGHQIYKLLAGSIVPRPIALVTTLSQAGVVNAAPYSFFNVVSADPPIVVLGLENRTDGAAKDTALNIQASEEFTINIVSTDMAAAMAICAKDFEYGVDELFHAGLTAVPGSKVSCPYIRETPVAFECRRYVSLAISRSREIVLGKVVYAHYRQDVLDQERLRINGTALDAIGRLTGSGYIATRDKFEL